MFFFFPLTVGTIMGKIKNSLILKNTEEVSRGPEISNRFEDTIHTVVH